MNNNSPFPFHRCSAIIIAGGKSSRMKSDKKYLKINETILLDKVVSQMEELFSDVIISTSPNSGVNSGKIKVVIDEFVDRGPLSGILSGLRGSKNDNNFIIAVDIPEISPELISEMYTYSEDYEIVVPESGKNKIEPLFGFYNKSIIPVIRKNLLMGENKILKIFDETETKIIRMRNRNWLFNINTEEDYKNYLVYLKNQQK